LNFQFDVIEIYNIVGMLCYFILDILDQDFNNALMNTSQNLIHQENNLFDFLTSAGTADFILHNETCNNEESQEIINESTAEEAKIVSNNNDSLTTNMIVSGGNYKSIYKIGS